MRPLLLLLLAATVARPAARLYPAPEGVAAAPDFDVRIDGKPAFVHDSPIAPFVHFSLSGPVEVTITARRVAYGAAQEHETWGKRYRPTPISLPLRAVEIRPHSAGIVPDVRGAVVRFRLARPANLSIEFDGNLSRPLFFFAAPEEQGAPAPGAPRVRYFAPGKVYDVGRLLLASGETIYIAGGAVVRGSILADGAEDARVLGRGVLDGSDEAKVSGPMIELRNCRNVRVEGVVILNNRGWTVIPRHSRQVAFDNIKMIAWNNNSDGVDIVGSQDVTIRASFFRNNDDCIPIKAAAEGDDAAPPPLERRGPSHHDVERVTVSECVFWKARGGNAFEIGFELRTTSIRNIALRNSDIIHVEGGAAFSIHNGDWAEVSDIEFENVRVEDAADELIDIFVGLSIYSADAPREYHRSNPNRKPVPAELRAPETGTHSGQWIRFQGEAAAPYRAGRGRVRNVRFLNIQVTGPRPKVSRVIGYSEESPVENVLIRGLTIGGVKVRKPEDGAFVVRNARNVRFE